MDKPFKDPTAGIKVIDVAIGHLGDHSVDALLHIKRLKKVRHILKILRDESVNSFNDSSINEIQKLYDIALKKASEKVGMNVKAFEYESCEPDFRRLIEDCDLSD